MSTGRRCGTFGFKNVAKSLSGIVEMRFHRALGYSEGYCDVGDRQSVHVEHGGHRPLLPWQRFEQSIEFVDRWYVTEDSCRDESTPNRRRLRCWRR